jgi:hypothetical protein
MSTDIFNLLSNLDYNVSNNKFLLLKKKNLFTTCLENDPKERSLEFGLFRPNEVILDKNHKYEINKYGYRSPEFNNTEILFAGCSHTFGYGVPEEKIWAVQIAKELKLNYYNVSMAGASTQWIVQKIFAYFKEYGNPKFLLCLFPDFYRMLSPVNYNTFISSNNKDTKNLEVNAIMMTNNIINQKHIKPRYSKIPHVAENVLPFELPVYLSFQYIQILEQYCKSNNIIFLWSTWHDETAKIINKAQIEFEVYSNYIDILSKNKLINENEKEFFVNNKNEIIQCHLDIKKEYLHCFDKGTDKEIVKSNRHMGVHRHTHISENFMEYIKNV